MTVDTAAQTGRNVTSFCHHIQNGADPYAAWAKFRHEEEIGWCEEFGGYWIISKYDDVERALKEPQTFSSARSEVTGEGSPVSLPSRPIKPLIPEEMDPPQSLPYRRLLNGILSPAAVKKMRERSRYWIDWYLDQIIEQGEADFVYDLTTPVTGAVTGEWLGFPREDWNRMATCQHDSNSAPRDSDQFKAAFADLTWTAQRVSEEIGERIAARDSNGSLPDDVMSYLVTQEIDGRVIEREMVEAMVRLLISGGVDTTAAATTSALVHLNSSPKDRERLIAEPELWDTAREEFFRRYPSLLGHSRTIVQDTEMHGCQMKAGERIFLGDASACHDEQYYENPFDVVLDRTPNRHVGFGLGTHRCAGIHLARVMFVDMVSQVLIRMPEFEVAEDQLERYSVQSAIAGWRSAPVTFAPGQRALAS